MKTDMLDVVNEQGEIIGAETRKKVHAEGLLHREVHVWFITPQGEVIFQHRAKDKDTYPDKLDATVGGHVDSGMSYDDTAVKECEEETGQNLHMNDLKFVKELRCRTHDASTGLINNTIRRQYVYLFDGDISDLRIENGKALGFEAWKIGDLRNLSEADKQRFIPIHLSEEILSVLDEGQKILGLHR